MSDPLEQFLIEYVDTIGGLADAVEPQVYDVLLPDAEQPVRVAFDPDALPEHPAAQLLTFGSALLDQLLEQAQTRGRVGIAFLDDVHLSPHTLEQRVRRELTLPAALVLHVDRARPFYVTHSLFWFEVTHSGDEIEQSLYPVAIDRYYGREVRYLDALLDGNRFSEIRGWAFPDATALPLAQSYLIAREAVARTARAEAKARQHQMQIRLREQTDRLKRYYADLRAELAERIEKTTARGDETESLRLRQDALNREESLRFEELQRKAQLRVQLELTNLLHVKVPRLLVDARVGVAEGKRIALRTTTLQLTWNPLVERTDAVACPTCRHPAFELRLDRQGELRCAACLTTGAR